MLLPSKSDKTAWKKLVNNRKKKRKHAQLHKILGRVFMTEVVYPNELKENKPKEQIILNRYHYVEMNPDKSLPIYQFKLHPHSNLNGAYVLIKDNSKILRHLNSGEKVDMRYYSKETDVPVELFNTQILNITKKEQGPFKGHFKVVLSIEDKKNFQC